MMKIILTLCLILTLASLSICRNEEKNYSTKQLVCQHIRKNSILLTDHHLFNHKCKNCCTKQIMNVHDNISFEKRCICEPISKERINQMMATLVDADIYDLMDRNH